MIIRHTIESCLDKVGRVVVSVNPQAGNRLREEIDVCQLLFPKTLPQYHKTTLTNFQGSFNIAHCGVGLGYMIPEVRTIRVFGYAGEKQRQVARVLVGLIAVITKVIKVNVHATDMQSKRWLGKSEQGG
jgi:hypothetical protein